jgi:hypothetical protein
VDYSLFIIVVVLVMSERLEKQPGTAPTLFPPPFFAGSKPLFHDSMFLHRLLTRMPCGVFI